MKKAMIFIDECDAMFGKRGDGERSFVTSIKSQFFVEMTGTKWNVSRGDVRFLSIAFLTLVSQEFGSKECHRYRQAMLVGIIIVPKKIGNFLAGYSFILCF